MSAHSFCECPLTQRVPTYTVSAHLLSECWLTLWVSTYSVRVHLLSECPLTQSVSTFDQQDLQEINYRRFKSCRYQRCLWNFNISRYLKIDMGRNMSARKVRRYSISKTTHFTTLIISPSCQNCCHCSVSIWLFIMIFTSHASKELPGWNVHCFVCSISLAILLGQRYIRKLRSSLIFSHIAL